MRQKQRVFSLFLLSPSSWRAWIEMIRPTARACALAVALLMEGVDRNDYSNLKYFNNLASPSSWRAWIEIYSDAQWMHKMSRRPPHGGRG